MQASYRWKPIEKWANEWVDDRLQEVVEEFKQHLDAQSWERLNQEVSREWSIEGGQIESVFDIDKGATVALIESGISETLIQPQRNGLSAQEVVEILHDMRSALEGVFAFVKGDRQLTESYIKELHGALLKSVDTREAYVESAEQGVRRRVRVPLLKGTYKLTRNNPYMPERGVHEYCPPELVVDEMERLVRIYGEMASEGYPPIVVAAWLHHAFAQIHPFEDGNGRVARALASVHLIRHGLLPLTVYRDMRTRYITALEAADRGDATEFVSVVESCVWRYAVRLWIEASAPKTRGLQVRDSLAALLDDVAQSRHLASTGSPVAWGQIRELRDMCRGIMVAQVKGVVDSIANRLGAPVTLGHAVYGSQIVGCAKLEAWGERLEAMTASQIEADVLTLGGKQPLKLVIGYDPLHATRQGMMAIVAAIEFADGVERVGAPIWLHFKGRARPDFIAQWVDQALQAVVLRWAEVNA